MARIRSAETPAAKFFRNLGPDPWRSLRTNVCHFRANTRILAETHKKRVFVGALHILQTRIIASCRAQNRAIPRACGDVPAVRGKNTRELFFKYQGIRFRYQGIHEGLEQARSLAAFEKGFSPLRKKLNEVKFFDDDPDLPFSPGIDYLDARLDLLAPLFDIAPSVDIERRILWSLLVQTGVLMGHQPKPPAREKDVQDALEWALILPFPETIREPAIANQTKSYHPDFGAQSLKTAIEVKFVAKKTDLGKAMGELYEDMRGYADSPAWEQFMGVLYLTGAFTSQERVDAELQKVMTPKNWKVCVVVGAGALAKAKKPLANDLGH